MSTMEEELRKLEQNDPEVKAAKENLDRVVDEIVEKAKDVPDPAATYNPSTRLSKKRDFIIERPGNINYAAPGGSYPGSRVVVFGQGYVEGLDDADRVKLSEQRKEVGRDEMQETAADLCNLYFMHRANLLTTAVIPGFDGSLTVLFTNHLEGKKLAYFQKYSSLMAETMEKFEAEEEVRIAKEADMVKASNAERDAMIELGKKCKDHNLLGKLKELGEEVEKLKKENNKLNKGKKT